MPCLNEAMDTMQTISKYDIAELKSMIDPPKMVHSVVKAVCILIGVEPAPAKTKQGTYEPSYWKAAIGSEVFGDPNLPERLA